MYSKQFHRVYTESITSPDFLASINFIDDDVFDDDDDVTPSTSEQSSPTVHLLDKNTIQWILGTCSTVTSKITIQQ